MLTIFNISVLSLTLTNLLYFSDLIFSNIEIYLIFEIVILGVTILMANRLGDKVLKGLQGTAATTIIVRGISDAIKSFSESNEKDNSGSNNSDSKNSESNNNPGSNNSDSNNNPGSNNSGSNNSESNNNPGSNNSDSNNNPGSNNSGSNNSESNNGNNNSSNNSEKK
jgi:hypothetical protein